MIWQGHDVRQEAFGQVSRCRFASWTRLLTVHCLKKAQRAQKAALSEALGP